VSDAAPGGLVELAFRVMKEFGLPVVLLAVVIYLFREAAIVVHTTLLVPVVESHTKFLDTTQETLREISTTQSRQADTLEELAAVQREIRQTVAGGAAPVRQP